jgi:hypothetical protein
MTPSFGYIKKIEGEIFYFLFQKTLEVRRWCLKSELPSFIVLEE